ncbi:hypothetical protein A4A37_21670 [Bacillus subtilis]|nr:hypothetical protein A4A37_21670 [Bacillus subtilis]
MNIIGSWFLLFAIGLLYKSVGTLNFSHIALRLSNMEDNQTVTMISLIFLVAFSSKAALVIFMWLPKAYAVLNTELAALFAALMTKVGAYALIRFFTLLFDTHEGVTHPLLIFMSCLTMIIGAFGVASFTGTFALASVLVSLLP